MNRSVGSRSVRSAARIAAISMSFTISGIALAQGTGPVTSAAGQVVNSRPLLAPHYQPFRTDFGFGAADILDQGAYGGSVSVEPKFNILDNLAVGARIEAMVGGGGNIGAPGSGEVTVKQNIAAATLLKTDFFLTRGAVRPWIGIGAGRYAIIGQGTSTSSSGASVDQHAGAYLGIAPQVGLEMGGFRIAATYNDILKAQVEVNQTVGGTTQTKKYSQNYVTVEIGFRLGGRRLGR